MREGRFIRDSLSFKEILDLEINQTEIDGVQNFCDVLGKSFAVTGVVGYCSLYNNEQLRALKNKTRIPYDKVINCIHANQNYHYMLSQMNQYT